MREAVALLVLLAGAAIPATPLMAQTANSYIGVKACGLCHKAAATGNQLGQWEKTKHAQAYATLTTAQANDIAKAKGLAKPAAESPECLECHAITDTPVAGSKMDPKEGVQCERCHGPGSAYKGMAVMKDRGKSIAAGMTEYADKAAIEAQCRKCHNERSPTMKAFVWTCSWPAAVPTSRAAACARIWTGRAPCWWRAGRVRPVSGCTPDST